MENRNFNYYITNYFKNYLPNVVGISHNSILSYRDTFIIFLNYLKDIKKINVNKIKLDDLNVNIIIDFLSYLENDRKNCERTRNQRLAAIHSFFKYIQKKELSYYNIYTDILSIPIKKVPKTTISYFSKDEFTKLIESINTDKKDGYRNYILFMLFYESCARVSEITNLKRKQLLFDKEYSSVILIGKGNKERNNPISNELSSLIKEYINIFNLDNDDYLFNSKFKQKFTTKGIEYLLNKYINISKVKYPYLYKRNYSTHSIRHSRATHLLEDGVPIEYIKDLLGHENLSTTYIYVEMSTKLKQEQIEKYSKNVNANNKFSIKKKQELMDFLKTL